MNQMEPRDPLDDFVTADELVSMFGISRDRVLRMLSGIRQRRFGKPARTKAGDAQTVFYLRQDVADWIREELR